MNFSSFARSCLLLLVGVGFHIHFPCGRSLPAIHMCLLWQPLHQYHGFHSLGAMFEILSFTLFTFTSFHYIILQVRSAAILSTFELIIVVDVCALANLAFPSLFVLSFTKCLGIVCHCSHKACAVALDVLYASLPLTLIAPLPAESL